MFFVGLSHPSAMIGGFVRPHHLGRRSGGSTSSRSVHGLQHFSGRWLDTAQEIGKLEENLMNVE